MTDTHFSMVFPGQGSQAVGMLKSLADDFALVTNTFDEASAVLGLDLWKLVREGPAEQLNQTHNTQPAMLAAGVAVWRIWQAESAMAPVIMAGHSLGEYSALVCAGAIKFADAVSLVADRGRYMQQAVAEGAGGMAAILGLEDDKIRDICRQAADTYRDVGGRATQGAKAESEVVEAVNYNSPGQVVIAGTKAAVERACELAKTAGAKRALLLPISVPSHCGLMKPAAERLSERLSEIEIALPTIPVLHNVSVTEAADATAIKQLLAQQLYSPVRWVETVQAIAARGVDTLVEAGPGKVLTGLTKRIDRKLNGLAVFDAEGLKTALERLK